MIVLDTNVISEVMRSPVSGPVTVWVESQPLNSLFATAISVAEILYGIRLLPAGKRQSTIAEQFQRFLDRGFRRQIVSFDEAAADKYSIIMARRRRIGRPMTPLDGMIAGIASSRDWSIATRDTAGFADAGISLVDPWL